MLKWRLLVGCARWLTIYGIDNGLKSKVTEMLRSARLGHQFKASFDDMSVSMFNEAVL